MHFLVLATDYDVTLAHAGVVDDKTASAVERPRNSGRRIVLVTGRHLPKFFLGSNSSIESLWKTVECALSTGDARRKAAVPASERALRQSASRAEYPVLRVRWKTQPPFHFPR